MGPPQPNVFTDTTKEDMVKALADNFLPTDNVSMEQNALVVNTGNQLVLIDTGLGAFKMMGNDTGRLVANLKAAGINPGDVDAVLLTHAHGDHCFGLLTADGSREFPNAQVYLTQSDYDFWTDEAKVSHPQIGQFVAATRKHLMPNRDRIVFIKDGQEVVPGIQAIAAPGHTVGHVAFMITSQGQIDLQHRRHRASPHHLGRDAAQGVRLRHRRQAGRGFAAEGVRHARGAADSADRLPFPVARHRPYRQARRRLPLLPVADAHRAVVRRGLAENRGTGHEEARICLRPRRRSFPSWLPNSTDRGSSRAQAARRASSWCSCTATAPTATT